MAKKATSKPAPTRSQPTSNTSDAPSWASKIDWLPLGLAAVAFVLYALTLGHPLVDFDDHTATVDNPAVKDWSLSRTFTHFNLGMYAPFTWTAYALANALGSGSALWFHLLCALVHAANTWLVFGLLTSIVGGDQPGRLTRTAISAVTLLFAIHPIQVESVAWVAGFSTPFYALFCLLAVRAYLRYTDGSDAPPQWGWYAAALGWFVAANLAKSAAVVLPLWLVIIDLWRNPPVGRTRRWAGYVPFFALSLGFGLLTIYSRETAQMAIRSTGNGVSFSALERVFLVFYTPVFYVAKLLLPVKLNVYYSFEKINGQLPILYWLSPLAWAGLGWLGWRHRQTVPLLGAGLIFFLVSHALTLPFAKVGEFELRADHYNYVACLGFFVALVAFWNALRTRSSLNQPLRWVSIGWAAGLAVLAIGQVKMWSSTVNLMNQAMANGYFQNGKMYLWRGMAYGNMGKRSEIPKALADFEQALKMNPELVDAYKYRGALYGVTGQYAQSVADLDRYLATQPADAPEYRFNRSISLINLNRRPEAMQELNKVIEEKPDFARAYRIRGSLRFEMGDSLSAQKDLDEFNRLGGEDVEPQGGEVPAFLK